MIAATKVGRAFVAASWIAVASILAACATNALPSQMSVKPGEVAALDAGAPGYHRFKVARVQGGGPTHPFLLSDVSDDDFRDALISSLAVTGYLDDDPSKADLELTASIEALERPIVALQPTVVSKVRYTVSPVGGGPPLFDDTLASSGSATLEESFLGPEPIRPANEAAMRANIAVFLQQLPDVLKAKLAAQSSR